MLCLYYNIVDLKSINFTLPHIFYIYENFQEYSRFKRKLNHVIYFFWKLLIKKYVNRLIADSFGGEMKKKKKKCEAFGEPIMFF